MSANVSTLGANVWYVDSGASNHMTGHGEWFRDMQDLERPGYVETRDDTSHPIKHIGNVSLTLQDGKVKYLADVLHVPSITKNLISVGQMVEKNLQVRFTPAGLFVEEYKEVGHLIAQGRRLIAQGKKVGRMFTLDVDIPEVKAAMFVQGTGVVADIEIWHKRIGHVNVQRLKNMQNQNIVTGIPKFRLMACRVYVKHVNLGNNPKLHFLMISM